MILKYLGIGLTPIIHFICYKNLINSKTKPKNLSALIVCFFIIVFIDLVSPISVYMPGIIITIFLFEKFIRKKSFFKAFFLSMMVELIFILCECTVGLFFMNILKIPYETIRNDSVTIIFLQLIILALVYLVSKFLEKLINKNLGMLKLKKHSKKLVLVLCINIISVFGIMYIFILSRDQMGLKNVIANMIGIGSVIYVLSSFVAIAFYGMYIKKDTELVQKTAESKQLGEYTDMIEYLYTDMRKFKHDHVNILSTLNGYIELDEIDELKEYIVKKLLPMGETLDKDDIRLGSLQNLRNIPLKGLLSSKLLQAQNRNMDVLVDIAEEIDINEKSMEIIDLCRSVGIFIDNALEASEKSNKKIVRIALVKRGESIIILVINSLAENIPPIHKMFKKGFSTKGENRGLGLANVSNIIRKYNNVTLDTYIEGDVFTQEMTLNILK